MILSIHVARQLWIQLRLLGILALPAIATFVAVIVDGQSGSQEAGRIALAVGLATAAVLSAALVGSGFAEEIRSGAAAWLVVRAVPRTALVGAWFVMPALAVLVAFVLAGILAGLALPLALLQAPDAIAVAVILVAAAAPALPLSAAGLVVAVYAPVRVTMVAVIGLAVIVAVPLVMLGDAAVHAASGYWLVAGMDPANRPITIGLQAIGLCMAVAGLLWGVAAVLFLRRDL